MMQQWLQIKGDPSIRKFLFEQERCNNEFDKDIHKVLLKIQNLILHHGIFHVMIHFSRGQITLWKKSDPCNYLVATKEEFLQPDFCREFEPQSYPDDAVVKPIDLHKILSKFKSMRASDEVIYLRTGSVNIINGNVGLNFSCDGSHYLDFQEFLARQDSFTV